MYFRTKIAKWIDPSYDEIECKSIERWKTICELRGQLTESDKRLVELQREVCNFNAIFGKRAVGVFIDRGNGVPFSTNFVKGQCTVRGMYLAFRGVPVA